MAKSITLAIVVGLSDVFWRPEMNFGRHIALVDDEKRRCEHAVMMKDGWDPNQVIEVSEYDENTLKDVEAIITAEMDLLNKVVVESEYPTNPVTKLNAAQRREAYKAIWFPNGKLHLPKYDGTYAFQRGKSLPDAVALIIATGKKPEQAVAEYHLPVRVVQYSSLAERIKACGLENTRKDTGRTSIMKHWPSLFELAYTYFSAKPSASQSEINELLAGGIVKNNNDGIKVHSLLILDHRFPTLGIKDKILKAGVDPDGKDLGQEFAGAIDRTRVWKMVQWLDEERAKKDAAQGVDFCTGKATTESDVAAYLADPKAGLDTKIVPMSKALVNTNMNTTPNLLEKYILHAVASGKAELLARLRHPFLSIELLTEMNDLAKKIGVVNDKGELVKDM